MTSAKLFRGLAVIVLLASAASFLCAQDSFVSVKGSADRVSTESDLAARDSSQHSLWSFPDFSATQVFQGRNSSMQMKVYRAGSSVRLERSAALSTLYVPAQSRVYNFTTYPDHSHQCVVMKPEQARMLPSPLELIHGANVKRTSAGTEEMEGHPCKVEKVVATQMDGTTVESKVWLAEDLQGIPVRIESYFPDVTLNAIYRDITIAAPDAALFAAPEKCTPFDKMGQVVENKIVK